MSNIDTLNGIIDKLNSNRSELSALFSLYNASLITAEDYRANLTEYFQKLIDCKNDLSALTQDISKLKKSEREKAFNSQKSRIKRINDEIVSLNKDFNSTCDNYKVVLKECVSLKNRIQTIVYVVKKRI